MRHAILFGALAITMAGTAHAECRPQPLPAEARATVTLDGEHLTIEQVVAVARGRARVAVAPAARKRMDETFALMMQGAAEGVPIYLFNRAPGSGRETPTFTGDPMGPENRPRLEARVLAQFQNGANAGVGPEVAGEDKIRANMLVRANGMTFLPASPQLLQGLVDLLNAGVTPVARTIGGTGEADGPIVGNVNGVLVGRGEAWFGGCRMPAADALAAAGLKPIAPAPGDGTVSTTNADYTAQAALLVADARRLLDWADLIYAMELNGMNSSVTPLFMPVQRHRPYKWLNWQAARTLGMIRGSYLFGEDPARIIQDPESLRASAIRQGSAWLAWARLAETVSIAINGSDHNPAVVAGLKPDDAWELNTPQALRYRITGATAAGRRTGYIFSNANWDPYPLDNDVEAFTIALANMDVAVNQRLDRFNNSFFTVIRPTDVIADLPRTPGLAAGGFAPQGNAKVSTDLWQEIQGLAVPVAPAGHAIIATVEDLQAQTRLKIARADTAIDRSFDLLAQNLLTASFWLDVRKAQDPGRAFGPGPTAAWAAFRARLPFRGAVPDGRSPFAVAGGFVREVPAAGLMPAGPAMPDGR
ncbi:aromatic amino acid ammonia-lyase [Sphingomonas sanxanigenens]|nr:aromatic amino acid ammonia-lyase [Sphingomonas sanxanigenens]